MFRWFQRRSAAPEREQVVQAIAQLPALPEADRMRHRPMERAKPKTLDGWRGLYDFPSKRRA